MSEQTTAVIAVPGEPPDLGPRLAAAPPSPTGAGDEPGPEPPAGPGPARQMLSREAILTVEQDAETEREVDVPEWGGKVRVRRLTVEQLGRTRHLGAGDEVATTVWTVILACAEPRFTDDDYAMLMQANPAALTRISGAVADLSGLTEAFARDAARGFRSRPDSGAAVQGGA